MTVKIKGNMIQDSVDGIINPDFALLLGKKIGSRYGPLIAVAMDDRTSNVMLKLAFTSGVMAVGCNVVDLGMVPTPILQYYMVNNPNVSGGVSITATFAGPEYNGFKLFGPSGLEEPYFDGLSLEEILEDDVPCVPATSTGTVYDTEDFIDDYIESIVSCVDAKAIADANLCIGIDCRNTEVGIIAYRLMSELSVACLTLGGNRDEIGRERVQKLGKLVNGPEINFGAVLEMDADHCLFTTSDGDPVEGDKIFALLVEKELSKKKGKVVIPVNSTSLMENVISDNEGLLMHVNIGEQMICRKVKEYDAIFGGDYYGRFIFPEFMYSSDAFMALARIVELVATKGPLATLVSKYPTYYIYKDSVKCPEGMIYTVIDDVITNYVGEHTHLLDGYKIPMENGWVLIRSSNIVDYIKVYSESTDNNTAKKYVDDIVSQIKYVMKKNNLSS